MQKLLTEVFKIAYAELKDNL